MTPTESYRSDPRLMDSRCGDRWIRTRIVNARILTNPNRLTVLVYPRWNEDCWVVRVRPRFEIERVRP